MVGWPPVRASRKNVIEGVIKSSKYVKVAVDGAPYLRKLDLQLYNSYQQLLKALELLFSSFTIRKSSDLPIILFVLYKKLGGGSQNNL